MFYFCVDFPSSIDLIGYVDLTDSYEIWPKCSFVINAQQCVRLFRYIFSFTRPQFTKIHKYSIRQLQNGFSRQPIGILKKPHTLLYSISLIDIVHFVLSFV